MYFKKVHNNSKHISSDMVFSCFRPNMPVSKPSSFRTMKKIISTTSMRKAPMSEMIRRKVTNSKMRPKFQTPIVGRKHRQVSECYIPCSEMATGDFAIIENEDRVEAVLIRAQIASAKRRMLLKRSRVLSQSNDSTTSENLN